MVNYIEILESALRRSGDDALSLLIHDRQNFTVRQKGPKEGFVTALDLKVDEFLRRHLLEPIQEKHPGARINWVSEDTTYKPDAGEISNPDFSIIVDSIDGTANLVAFLAALKTEDQAREKLTARFNRQHAIVASPHALETNGDEFCISVAIMDGKSRNIASGVYDFVNDVMVTAYDGKIRFNSKPIAIENSRVQSLHQARFVGGKETKLLSSALGLGGGNEIILSGSIAYRMALLALAKADVMVGPKIPTHVWDVAAGAHLCEASGYVVRDLYGAPIDWSKEEIRGIMAAPEQLSDEFATCVRGRIGMIELWNFGKDSASALGDALRKIPGLRP